MWESDEDSVNDKAVLLPCRLLHIVCVCVCGGGRGGGVSHDACERMGLVYGNGAGIAPRILVK